MKKPTAIIYGKRQELSISIDSESVNIYVDNGEGKEPLHIVYWHLDEVEEDASVAISIANAIHLYYTNPQELVDKLGLRK
jgi:hypothetical protein